MRTLLMALVTVALLGCGDTLGSSGEDAGNRDAHANVDARDAHAGDAHARDAGHDARKDVTSPDASPGDAGVPCYANTDCVGGTCSYAKMVCMGNDCTTAPACPGTCTAYAAPGGFCLFPGPPACAPDSGLTCDPFSHQCVPPASETLPVADGGAACGLGVADCIPGYYCYAPVFPDNGQCQPVVGDGGACDPVVGGCAGALVCAGFSDGGTCRPPASAGGACVTPQPGAGGSSGCNQGLLCLDGGCVPLPTTGPCLEGQCNPDAGTCASSGACVPWVANGGACMSGSDCLSGLCASTTQKCVAALPVGAACEGGPFDCSGGLCPGDQIECESQICDVTGHCAAAMCPRPAGK